MKYQYKEFVEKRDLEQFIENSKPALESLGIDPAVFYAALNERPEILDLEPEEAINELIGFVPDALRSVGSAFKGLGAGRQAARTDKDIAFLKSLSPEELQKYGLTQDNIAQLEKEKAGQQATAGRGFFGNMTQGWRDARQNRQNLSQQQRLAGFQQRFGTGPFAPRPTNTPTQPTQQTQAPAGQQTVAQQFVALNGRLDQLEKLVKSMQGGGNGGLAMPSPQQVAQYGR